MATRPVGPNFIDLNGQDGLDAQGAVAAATVRRLTTDPVDPDATATAVHNAGGRAGDIYIAPSGMLYELVNENGTWSMESVGRLVGPEGPAGADAAAAPHGLPEHGVSTPVRVQAGDYSELAVVPSRGIFPLPFPAVP